MRARDRAIVLSLNLLAVLGIAEAPAQQRDTLRLPDIVVTATRVPTERERLAQRVTVLTGEELRSRGYSYLSDALQGTAGLTVVQTGSTGGLTSVFLRGGESDYVQVLIDGVVANEPGGAFNFGDLTVDNVDRVEIVRGPASVLYGSDAVAGVIQVFTRRMAPRAEIGFRAGTYGTVDVDAAVGGGGPGGGYSLAFSRATTDGLYPFNNRYRNATASGRVLFRPDDRTSVDLALRYTDGAFRFPTDGAGNVVDSNALQLNEATTVGADVSRYLSDRVETRLLLSSNNVDAGLDDRADGPGDTTGVFASRSQRTLRRHAADLRANIRVHSSTILTAGVVLQQERERSTRTDFSSFGTFSSGTDTTMTRLNRGYYAQALATWSGLSLTAGGRVDDNQKFGVFVTYRAGATYRFPTGTRLFASAGSAFKEPTFLENFGGGFVIGNRDLEPERSTSQEAGLEQTIFGGRVTIAGTVFRQRFRNMIDFTFAPPAPVPGGANLCRVSPANPTPNYCNIVGATADGIELELAVRPMRGLTLSGSYAGLKSEVTDSGFEGGAGSQFGAGQRLLRRPASMVNALASYKVSSIATVSAAVRRVGERDDLDFSVFPFLRDTLPAYTILDVSAEVNLPRPAPGWPAATLTARVENGGKTTYEHVKGFPGRGRAVLLGGRVGF